MADPLKIMFILPHPDDETLSCGGTIAKYAAEGAQVHLVMATKGEHGWALKTPPYPGPQEAAKVRERELRCAAQALGIHEVYFLGIEDGRLPALPFDEAAARLVPYIREVKPQVVVTFDPSGVYGHPDHIALTQFAVQSVVLAASAEYAAGQDLPPFTVKKLYYTAETEAWFNAVIQQVGRIEFPVDGVQRSFVGWKDWAVSARIDISAYWDQVLAAIRCHASQNLNPEGYARVLQTSDRSLWGYNTFYRVYSLVNSGTQVESDLFEGLREG